MFIFSKKNTKRPAYAAYAAFALGAVIISASSLPFLSGKVTPYTSHLDKYTDNMRRYVLYKRDLFFKTDEQVINNTSLKEFLVHNNSDDGPSKVVLNNVINATKPSRYVDLCVFFFIDIFLTSFSQFWMPDLWHMLIFFRLAFVPHYCKICSFLVLHVYKFHVSDTAVSHLPTAQRFPSNSLLLCLTILSHNHTLLMTILVRKTFLFSNGSSLEDCCSLMIQPLPLFFDPKCPYFIKKINTDNQNHTFFFAVQCILSHTA